MSLRHLLASATVLGAVAFATPADATVVCVTVYVNKEVLTEPCVPWGSPLPPVGCPVNEPDLVRVCEF